MSHLGFFYYEVIILAYIYHIKNNLTQQVYIGQAATQDYNRMWEHFDYIYPTNRGISSSSKDSAKVTEMMKNGGLSDFTITIYQEEDNYGINESIFQTFAQVFLPEGKSLSNLKTWYVKNRKTETNATIILDKRQKLDMAEILHTINAVRFGQQLVNTDLGGTYKYWSLGGAKGGTYQLFRDKSPRENYGVFEVSTQLLNQAQQIIDKHVHNFIKGASNYVNQLGHIVLNTFLGSNLDKDYRSLRNLLLLNMGWVKTGKGKKLKYQYEGGWEATSNSRLYYMFEQIRNDLKILGIPLSVTIDFQSPNSTNKQGYGSFKKTLAETLAANVVYQNKTFRQLLTSNPQDLKFSGSNSLFTISAAQILDFTGINIPKSTWWHCDPIPSKVITENAKKSRSLRYFSNIIKQVKDATIYDGARAYVSEELNFIAGGNLEWSEGNIETSNLKIGFVRLAAGRNHRPLTLKVRDKYIGLGLRGSFLDDWDCFFAAMYNGFCQNNNPWQKYTDNIYYKQDENFKFPYMSRYEQDDSIKLYGAYRFNDTIDITLQIQQLKHY